MKKKIEADVQENVEPANFEDSMRNLEQVVADLESGRLGLEAALTRYEEGIRYLKSCHKFLQGAERRIEQITAVGADGQISTIPFIDEDALTATEGGMRGPRRRS